MAAAPTTAPNSVSIRRAALPSIHLSHAALPSVGLGLPLALSVCLSVPSRPVSGAANAQAGDW